MPDNAAFPSSSSSFVLVAVAAAGAAAVCYVRVGPSVAVVAVEALMLSEKANLPGRAYKSGNVRSSSLLESRTTLEASVRGIRESCYWQWPCQDNHGLLVTFLLSSQQARVQKTN